MSVYFRLPASTAGLPTESGLPLFGRQRGRAGPGSYREAHIAHQTLNVFRSPNYSGGGHEDRAASDTRQGVLGARVVVRVYGLQVRQPVDGVVEVTEEAELSICSQIVLCFMHAKERKWINSDLAFLQELLSSE